MQERRLIINADDLGMNAARSHGIFQCMEFGVVTNASLVVNTTESEAAARRGRERGFTIGLHLNLTEEYPLSAPDDVASLLDSNGMFLDRDKFRTALAEGEVAREHVEREVRAQVEWIFDHYGAPTHIDGHHHSHIFPMVIDALVPLMERYGIRAVRSPIEEPLPPFGYEVDPDLLEKIQRVNDIARRACELYDAHGFMTTGHFRGATLVGNASLKNLRHVLGRLPEGTTELMVHPGSQAAYGTPFDLDPQRQTELRMLLDESIMDMIQEKHVSLCSWVDL